MYRTSKATLIAMLAAMIPVSAHGQSSRPVAPMSVGVAMAAKAVCRPTLKVDADTYEAGTAFLVSGARPLLLTAQHLFGPDGGLYKPVTWQDMPAHAHVVSCKPIWTGTPVSGETAIAIPGAHGMSPDDQKGGLNDVAVFRTLPESSLATSLTLADSPAKVGDEVFLIARALGSDSFIHAARVTDVLNGALLFAYDDPKLQIRATSGAPIVNMRGKVVGLNLGGGYDDEAKTVIGIADDLGVLTKAVAAAGDH
jgi:hypothetical protein